MNNYPLILVFYLSKTHLNELPDINSFAEAVSQKIEEGGYNILVFFLPTENDTRLECINPIQVKETDMEEINKIVSEIRLSFDNDFEINKN